MKKNCYSLLTLSTVLFIQCNQETHEGFLGSSVIESTTIQVATTAQGTISATFKNEGDQVAVSETLAIIDTIPLVLKRIELESGRKEITSSIKAKQMEIDAIERDLAGLENEYKRIESLTQKGAAPIQQRDNLKTQLESLKLKRDAQMAFLVSIRDKSATMAVIIEQVEDQLKHCIVKASDNGIICTKYRNVFEVVGPGNPLFELCVNDTLRADFFVPQTIMGSLAIGDTLRVRIDNQADRKSSPVFLPAKLTWISNEAEFSPKNIQTRESRNELVFRMRVTIANRDGILKRGLPVEIWR